MADVANSIGTSPQGRSNSYVSSPCSSNNAIVSPNIVEAIDRIFPKSPSQLLTHPFPENHPARRTSVTTAQSTLPCPVSVAYLTTDTTTDTTTTATAVFTGLTTSVGTKSPVMSSTPSSHMDLPSLPAQTKVPQVLPVKNGTVDINPKKSDVQKDPIRAKRISRADFEIMNNYGHLNQFNVERERFWGSNLSEKESNDSQSKDLSDSDDMCRPFVKAKKKKKKKKRLKERDEGNEIGSSISVPQATTELSGGDDLCSENSKDCSNAYSSGDGDRFSDLNSSNNVLSVTETVSSSSDILSNSNSFPKDTSQEGKVTVVKRRSDRQKLPKSTRNRYHLHRNLKHIKKIFLPCFVVLQRIENVLEQKRSNDENIPFNLSTKERVAVLLSLCAQKRIDCDIRKKNIEEVLDYKSFGNDSMLNNSEDEFQIQSGRSLRKRRQVISYVEPSEDDLLEVLTECTPKKKSKHSNKDDFKNGLSSSSSSIMEVPEKGEKLSMEVGSESKEISSNINYKILFPPSITKEISCVRNKIASPPSTKSAEIHHFPSQDVWKNAEVSHSTTKATTGPNLVYVYPKKNIQGAAAQSSDKHTVKNHTGVSKVTNLMSPRPGPASKTNRPLNTIPIAPMSAMSVSTNSNTAPVIVGLSGASLSLAASSLPQNLNVQAANPTISSIIQRNSNMAPNMCMLKIDGKDYLVSMPPSNATLDPATGLMTTTGSAVIPFTNSSLISSASPRYRLMPNPGITPSIRPIMLPQATATSKGLSSSHTIPPRMSIAVTLPGRASSTAIHVLPTSLSLTTAMSSAPLLGSALASTTPNAALSSVQSLLSSSSIVPRSTNSITRLPSTLSSIISTGSISTSLQTTSTTISTSSGGRQIQSLITPFIAPGSSTVVPLQPGQTAAPLSSSVQLVAPNSASGARCFRIIVPACSASGTTARFATLGTSALGSPLTRLAASSSLLPQRQMSCDKNMSPEKRAAKRRRLEKKYPLPPGVVIKTESLDSPQPTATVQSGSVRSLLSAQNIQLIAASARSGASGVQRFRIISPNASGVMVGSRPVRLSSNVIIRAPLMSSSASRVAIPSSLTLSSLPSATTSLAAVTSFTAPNAALATTTLTTTTVSASTSVTTSSRGTISLLSTATLLVSSNGMATSSMPNSTINTTHASSSGNNTLLTSSSGPIQASSSSGHNDQPTPDSLLSPLTQSGKKSTNDSNAVLDIETVRQDVEKLHKLISAQEALGLRGARLDKLKELYGNKKSSLTELEQAANGSLNEGGDEDMPINIGESIDDPVVID